MAEAWVTNRPNSCTSARLDHICIESSDPQALAEFYAEHLRYAIEPLAQGAFAAIGPDRRIIFRSGQARTLGYSAFAMDDEEALKRLADRITSAGCVVEPFEDPFSLPGGFAVRGPDGDLFAFARSALAADRSPPLKEDAEARLQHVVMASRDAGRVTDFATDVLGFTVSDTVVGSDGLVRTAFLRCSHEHHSFAVFQAPQNRLDHHCYEVPDWNAMRDWADHFGKGRIPLQWGPGRHGPGNNLFLFIHDRDGNWVELSAELEIVNHERPAGVWPHEEHTANSWGKGVLRSE